MHNFSFQLKKIFFITKLKLSFFILLNTPTIQAIILKIPDLPYLEKRVIALSDALSKKSNLNLNKIDRSDKRLEVFMKAIKKETKLFLHHPSKVFLEDKTYQYNLNDLVRFLVSFVQQKHNRDLRDLREFLRFVGIKKFSTKTIFLDGIDFSFSHPANLFVPYNIAFFNVSFQEALFIHNLLYKVDFLKCDLTYASFGDHKNKGINVLLDQVSFSKSKLTLTSFIGTMVHIRKEEDQFAHYLLDKSDMVGFEYFSFTAESEEIIKSFNTQHKPYFDSRAESYVKTIRNHYFDYEFSTDKIRIFRQGAFPNNRLENIAVHHPIKK